MTIKNEMWLEAGIFGALCLILHYKPSFLISFPDESSRKIVVGANRGQKDCQYHKASFLPKLLVFFQPYQ